DGPEPLPPQGVQDFDASSSIHAHRQPPILEVSLALALEQPRQVFLAVALAVVYGEIAPVERPAAIAPLLVDRVELHVEIRLAVAALQPLGLGGIDDALAGQQARVGG